MEFRLFKIAIKSLRSSLVSILLKYAKPIRAINSKNNEVLIKLINLTIAVPMHAFLSTPNDLRNSSFPIFQNISTTDPQLISNSL